MKHGDLKAGDLLIDFQKGYGKEFLVVQENNDLFLELGTIRQRIEDSNIQGCHLLIRNE